MDKLLRKLIGHGHNFATRCWAITVFAVYWFDRLAPENAALQSSISQMNRELFYLGVACIVIIILAGTGRTFYPTNVVKIFDKSREKQRIRQLSKMYVIVFAFVFAAIYLRYGFPVIRKELLTLGVVCLVIMVPLEIERSLRFRILGNKYGEDPEKLENIWKKMMFVWHIVLMAALTAGTYWQYTLVFK
jgi:hypothetical protein